jgi:hypothetical protein
MKPADASGGAPNWPHGEAASPVTDTAMPVTLF